MLGSLFGRFLGGDETAEEQPLHLPLGKEEQAEKALNASPTSTATPGSRVAESPLTPSRHLGVIGAPPGLCSLRPVPPLPFSTKDFDAAKDEPRKIEVAADSPSAARQLLLAEALQPATSPSGATLTLSLAEALPEASDKEGDGSRSAPGSPVVSLSAALPEPELGSGELPTLGSRSHRLGMCKPCAFLHTKGCKNGKECPFCHLCERGEKKKRLREKWQQKQADFAMEQCVVAQAALAGMPFLPPFPLVASVMDNTLMDPSLFYLSTTGLDFESAFQSAMFEPPTPVSLADALAKTP